jgi:DNA topoisomerase-1
MTTIERLQARGIRRIRARTGFRYAAAGGGRVTAADRERIAALRSPPAWRDVAISPSARNPVQAVGRDKAGRWQYLYHAAHVARRERRKQERLLRFIASLPKMRRTIAKDLAQPGIPRTKVLAGIVRVLSTCFLRPGSAVYARENGSYGIATLQSRHVRVVGPVVAFDFVGKSGQRQRRELHDRRLATLVRELLRHPGEVFKFRSESGDITDVTTAHINAYLKDVMGQQFSAKDFRTWAANLLFAHLLARPEAAAPAGGAARPSRTALRREVTAALREVSHHLGNTPAVVRASYVFDRLLDGHLRGRRLRNVAGSTAAFGSWSRGTLERNERALIELLRAS